MTRFPDLMTMLSAQEGAAVPQTRYGARPDMARPVEEPAPDPLEENIPLTVVMTMDDPQSGKPLVFFEDPDGVEFAVPRDWVGFDPDAAGEDPVPHTVIDKAPPGQLKEVWNEATRNMWTKQGEREKNPQLLKDWQDNGGVSLFDMWEENKAVNPDYKGDERLGPTYKTMREASGEPTGGRKASGMLPLDTGTGWQPQVRPPAAPTVRRKEDIPPEAGTGLGNWDEEWDDRLQRWVKVR